MSEETSCCHHHDKAKPWCFRGEGMVLLLLGGVLSASFVSPFLIPFRQSFTEYAQILWFPMLLGLLIGGMMDHFIPKSYISKYLAPARRKTILYSVGFGFLMSVCSHGILALAVELHKKGASAPAVISFLLASPWASFPIMILLISFFGWKAFLLIFGALGIALTTGVFFQALDRWGWIEKNPHSVPVDSEFSITSDMTQRARSYQWTFINIRSSIFGILSGVRNLAKMILFWMIVGMTFASVAGAYVPPHFFQEYLGPSIIGLFSTLLFATVIEVCSEGTAPLAFEIYRQTGAFGNVFVFLMAGVMTDFTEIALIWKNLGKKSAFWMIFLTLPQVVVLAFLYNKIS